MIPLRLLPVVERPFQDPLLLALQIVPCFPGSKSFENLVIVVSDKVFSENLPAVIFHLLIDVFVFDFEFLGQPIILPYFGVFLFNLRLLLYLFFSEEFYLGFPSKFAPPSVEVSHMPPINPGIEDGQLLSGSPEVGHKLYDVFVFFADFPLLNVFLKFLSSLNINSMLCNKLKVVLHNIKGVSLEPIPCTG